MPDMQRFGRVELEGTRRKGAAGRSHMLGKSSFETKRVMLLLRPTQSLRRKADHWSHTVYTYITMNKQPCGGSHL